MRRLLMLAGWIALHANAELPSSNGVAAAPDDWLLGQGRAWHHRTTPNLTPAPLVYRDPTPTEAVIVARAEQLFAQRPAKAMALVRGRDVVWSAMKQGTADRTLLLSFSIGKTVTSVAVGQALCSGALNLEAPAAVLVPELAQRDLGRATLHDLLRMASGTWEGQVDSTITTPEQNEALLTGRLSLLQVLTTERVSAAERGFMGRMRAPGERFAYRSTDPLLAAVLLQRATGQSYAAYVEQQVLKPAGVRGPAVIGQDHFGFGEAAGNVRMTLQDWIRFAAWLYERRDGDDCLGRYLRDASRTQIVNAAKRHGQLFDGYGYYLWTDNRLAPGSFWAVGHGGQRLGWNTSNPRVLVLFSNEESFMPEVYRLYRDWAALP